MEIQGRLVHFNLKIQGFVYQKMVQVELNYIIIY